MPHAWVLQRGMSLCVPVQPWSVTQRSGRVSVRSGHGVGLGRRVLSHVCYELCVAGLSVLIV